RDLDQHLARLALRELVGEDLLHLLHDLRPELAADQALRGRDRGVRVDLGVLLRFRADEPVSLLVDGEYRGDGSGAVSVGDDLRLSGLDEGSARVRGAEVDPDRSTHRVASCRFRGRTRITVPLVADWR